jgi:hypothetical protein
MKEEVGRPDAVFSYCSLLLKDGEFKEALNLLQKENEFMKTINPTSVKRSTYAIDCVLISIIINDVIMAERFLEGYGDEYAIIYLESKASVHLETHCSARR